MRSLEVPGTSTHSPSHNLFCRRRQRLVQVPEDVFDVLQADAQADEVGADTGCGHLLGRQLAVGGAGRVDGQALGIADVGEVAEELQVVDELLPGFDAALDAKAEDRARTLRQVLLGQLMVRMALADPDR